MSTTPEPDLVTIDSVTTATVRDNVPMAGLRDFFDASFQALGRVVAAQEVTVQSPAFGRYRGTPGETLDVEVGFATDRAVSSSEGASTVHASTLPGGKVARLVHHGGFDGLGASWARLGSWIESQGLSATDDRWEVYVTQPTPETDPQTLRTELNWLLAE